MGVLTDLGIDNQLSEAIYASESDWRQNPFAIDAAVTVRELAEADVVIGIVSDIHFDIRPSFRAIGVDDALPPTHCPSRLALRSRIPRSPTMPTVHSRLHPHRRCSLGTGRVQRGRSRARNDDSAAAASQLARGHSAPCSRTASGPRIPALARKRVTRFAADICIDQTMTDARAAAERITCSPAHPTTTAHAADSRTAPRRHGAQCHGPPARVPRAVDKHQVIRIISGGNPGLGCFNEEVELEHDI